MKKTRIHTNTVKKKGFTLLELLAVLIILSALTAIIIPLFQNNSDEAKQIAHDVNMQTLITQAQSYLIDNTVVGVQGDILADMLAKGYIRDIPQNPYTREQYFDSKNYIVSVNSSGKIKVALGTGDNGIYNKPELTQGMTPVKWNGTNDFVPLANETEKTNGTWYNYVADNGVDRNTVERETNERWANVRLTDGSMLVWIPRFTYKVEISPAKRIRVRYTRGVADDTSGGYISHPAFTFGNTELTGFWVAKYEASSVEDGVSGANNGGGDTISKTIAIKPDVISWRDIEVEKIFELSRNMESKESTYGWKQKLIDTHMMKNSEWGAVAFLTESIRDGQEVWVNPDNSYYTGRGGSGVSTGNIAHASTTNYYTANGPKTSTTGNVYGIYDLSGGSWEYTAAYINNGHPNLITNYGKKLIDSDKRYVDVYTASQNDKSENWDRSSANAISITQENYNLWSNYKGHALTETSTGASGNTIVPWSWVGGKNNTGWYNDYTLGGWADIPFFIRGGPCYDYSAAGIFAFNNIYGNPSIYRGFRPVCLVGVFI